MRSSLRCVFDTNVLISALLFDKSEPAQAFFIALSNGEVLVSTDTISELSEVLSREKFDKYLTEEERERFLRSLLRDARLVEVHEKVRACRDPKDDKFLELAVNGAADCIVSGDDDLISLHPFRSVQILIPKGSPVHEERYVAEGFGGSPELAAKLGVLVTSETKTATCAALWEWEAEDASLPKVGDKAMVLGGDGEPLCVIETTEVEVRPFEEVDARFAYEEGEGDRSLEYWRKAHWRFFSRTLPQVGKEPVLDMPLVCERFRVIYR